ncbi:MAG: nucleoside triphosphate pyrophosphatase [Candidatus Omnitrophota bacterium]|jgi:septum formation protein
MRKIILASKSKARKKLLKQLGINFVTASSNVKEDHKLLGSCKGLVISNALAKAKDVAARFERGIVIAADTVVLADKKIIGKPRNMKDAANTLKLLSRKPQWVYTGIAVIDIDKRKTLTDYEKTKIYMIPLSDRMIKKYFTKVSPLDHAGSFDIQGFGGIFIDRIEGCFYNVVGLPVAKLAKLLAKVGINIF